jgi:hypothetical protein
MPPNASIGLSAHSAAPSAVGNSSGVHGLAVDELLAPPSAGGQESVERVSGRHLGAVPGADHEVRLDGRGGVEDREGVDGGGRCIGQHVGEDHAPHDT